MIFMDRIVSPSCAGQSGGVDEVMKAEPRKVSGLHISEILSVRIRLTCSPLLIRQRDGSSPASAWWVCAGSAAELCRPPASPSSDPSRPQHHQSWCWCSDLQKTHGLKVYKGACSHSPGLKHDFISPVAEEEVHPTNQMLTKVPG